MSFKSVMYLDLALVVQRIGRGLAEAVIEVRFLSRAQVDESHPLWVSFCVFVMPSRGIELEGGRGNSSFPVWENIKNRGFLKRSVATSEIAKRPLEGTN
jgi:hypothetical protein